MKLPKSESFWKMSRRKERNSMISSFFFKIPSSKKSSFLWFPMFAKCFPNFLRFGQVPSSSTTVKSTFSPFHSSKRQSPFLRTAPTNLKSYIRLLNKFIQRRTLRLPKACAATSINYLAIFLCSDGAG